MAFFGVDVDAIGHCDFGILLAFREVEILMEGVLTFKVQKCVFTLVHGKEDENRRFWCLDRCTITPIAYHD